MKSVVRIAAVGGMLGLSACGLPGTFYAEPFANQMINGEGFNHHLARVYQDRVKETAANDVNWMLAGMYAKKGRAAAANEVVLPWNPDTYYESITLSEGVDAGRAQKYDLHNHYNHLMTALDNGGREQRPYECAQAQGHYDWLVDEVYQDTPPAPAEEEDMIAAHFQEALAKCKGQIVHKQAPAQANEWVVYFGWDRYNLTRQAHQVVHHVVDTVRDMSGAALSVIGFTDTSGSKRYNDVLSVRRANSVSHALKHGRVNATVAREGRGENELAKPTADGVREPLNRRVTITLQK